MANRYDNLYSVGPGAMGPGTHITQSQLDPQTNRGTITRIYEDTTGIDVSQLASLYTLSDSEFPGTSVRLDSTYVRQISDTLALVVSRYGSSNGGTNFRTVMTRTPGGYRDYPVYDVSEEYTKVKSNYAALGAFPILKPASTRSYDTMVISWSNVVYQSGKPNDNFNLIGKVNANKYTIWGYEHAAETLKFAGTRIRYDKYGGYDRWTIHHTVSYDPLGKHKTEGRPSPVEQRDDGTWSFAAGKFAQYHDKVVFPNLP